MGAKSGNFCLFSAYFGVFSPDLWMEYRIFISNVDISANLENIDIDKEISENIDIDKISNRLEFGISNRAKAHTGENATNMTISGKQFKDTHENKYFQKSRYRYLSPIPVYQYFPVYRRGLPVRQMRKQARQDTANCDTK